MCKIALKSIWIVLGFALVIMCAGMLFLAFQVSRIRSGLPTAGPGRAGGGGSDVARIIEVSTNCADVGEIVTLSIILENRANDPVIIEEPQLLDIILEPTEWHRPEDRPIRRWSETDQYPSTTTKVLSPGEQRVYEWHWTVEAVYAQQLPAQNTMKVTLVTSDFSLKGAIFPGGETTFGIGIGSYPWVNGAVFTCAELRQNR